MIVSSGGKSYLRSDITAKARINGDYIQISYHEEGLRKVILISTRELRAYFDEMRSDTDVLVDINIDQAINLGTLVDEFITRVNWLYARE